MALNDPKLCILKLCCVHVCTHHNLYIYTYYSIKKVKTILNFVLRPLFEGQREKNRKKGEEPHSLLQTHTNIDRAPAAAFRSFFASSLVASSRRPALPSGRHRAHRQTSPTISCKQTHTGSLLKIETHPTERNNPKHPETHFLLLFFSVVSLCVLLRRLLFFPLWG